MNLPHNLNRLASAVHNEFTSLSDDDRENIVTEFFVNLSEGQWEEEMADALEKLGYTVTKE